MKSLMSSKLTNPMKKTSKAKMRAGYNKGMKAAGIKPIKNPIK